MAMSGRPREFDNAAVIDAAMDVFWEHGYEATSAEKLCARTGLGRGSLYNAFGSKKKLFEESLRLYHARALDIKKGVLEGPGTVKERLTTFLTSCLSIAQDSQENRICLAIFGALEQGRKDPVIDEMNRAHLARLEAAILRVFEQGQHSGEVVADRSAASMVKGFLASYHGLCLLGQAMPDREFFMAAVDETLARILV